MILVAGPYIHALAPRLIENLHNDRVKEVKNEVDLAIVLESIATVESLVSITEPYNRKYDLN